MIACVSLIFVVWTAFVAWIANNLNSRGKVLDAFLNALEMKGALIQRQKHHAIALSHNDYMRKISELESTIDGLSRMEENMKEER